MNRRTFSLAALAVLSVLGTAARADRYRADVDGETVGVVPVPADLLAAFRKQASDIFERSKIAVTDPLMPAGAMIYTPGPYYREAGVFGRDFLFQLEGGGRSTVTAEEIKWAVDFMALKQLTAVHVIQGCTYPIGAIPDRVRPDGQIAWGPGPGDAVGDHISRYHRPSLDEALCFVTLSWHYGHKAHWDAEWKRWFALRAPQLAAAWNSVPRNPANGLVTQWTTPGHLGAGGITETTGACVMWGFHDSYGFPGDDLGTSVLACNAARALADGYDHAGDTAAAAEWAARAEAMQAALQRQFNPAGYLPWGVGPGAPTMASPDITGYAVWSGILTAAQADAASDWFAARYVADRAAGGTADLFNFTPGLRGSIRMARKADDVYPGSHVWPHQAAPYWENLTYGYNAYQDGGYWYYMSLGVATTLARKHPGKAREWTMAAYHDLIAAGPDSPCERIDGTKPVNNRYNASAGSLLGIGRAETSAGNQPPPGATRRRIAGATIGAPVQYPGLHGDTWTTTWADDGELYAVADDCFGLKAAPINSNLAIFRIRGTPPNHFQVETVNPMTGFGKLTSLLEDKASWKGSGLACIDGTLYLAVSRHHYMEAESSWIQQSWDATLIKSTDHGQTWSAAPKLDHAMFPGRVFSNPYFVQYGQDGQAGPDGSDRYVYAVSNDGDWNNGSWMTVGRVPRERLARLDPADWEFVHRFEAGHVPVWSRRHDNALATFSAPGRTGMTGVQYFSALNRYVMAQWHYPHLDDPDEARRWQVGRFELYEAPAPWGPWTLFHTQDFAPQGLYNPGISAKFISPDGLSCWIIASGDFFPSKDGNPYYTINLLPVKLAVETRD